MNRKTIVLICVLAFIIAMTFLLPAVIMGLFNTCVPGLLGIASLTYWQAFGLYILCGILFNQPDLNNENLKNKITKILDELADDTLEESEDE